MAGAWTLAPGEVHVWLTGAESALEPAWLAGALDLLTADERVRHDRFVFDRSKRQFLVARALVRRVLAGYTGIAAEALRFTANAYGRPALMPAHGELCFNLSHAEGLAALAVAWGGEVGVDVEDCARRSRPESIAEHFFAAAEVEGLMALPEEARPGRFFDLWTLKEAYIKARGMGLSIPLGDFAYDLSRGREAIELALAPTLGDVRAGWHFVLRDAPPHHRLALALRFPGGAPPTVHTRWICPIGQGQWRAAEAGDQPPF